MRILVTGSNGMVGRNIVRLLSKKKKYKIYCLDLIKIFLKIIILHMFNVTY